MRYSKLVKLLGLAALLALAVAATVPAAAGAAPTVLCKENTTKCSGANTYASGTAFEASLKAGTKLTMTNNALFSAPVECTGSTMKGTTSELGKPLNTNVSSITLSGCKAGSCSAPEAHNLPVNAGIEAAAAGNGSFTLSSGGSGNPGFSINCPSIAVCQYGSSQLALAFEGGNPAYVVAKKLSIPRESGSAFFCDSNIVLSATYEVTSPKPVYASSANATVLCKANTTTCSAENTLPSGTTLSGTNSGAEFKLSGFSGYEQSCSGSTVSFVTNAASGEPLPATFKSMSFSGCKGLCSTVTASVGESASIDPIGNGNGDIKTPLKVEFSNCHLVTGCVYQNLNSHFELAGGAPGQIKAKELELGLSSGVEAYCGSVLTLNAYYKLTSPSSVWVKTSS